MAKKVKGKDLAGLLIDYAEQFVRNFAEEAGHRTVDKTPVNEGRLRGSIGIGSASFGKTDPSGSKSKARISQQAKTLEIDQDYRIISSAPYAYDVEKGSSKKAPNGFLARTANETDDIAKEAIRKIK